MAQMVEIIRSLRMLKDGIQFGLTPDTRKERIKRRSFEPGTLKTLKDLREDGNV